MSTKTATKKSSAQRDEARAERWQMIRTAAESAELSILTVPGFFEAVETLAKASGLSPRNAGVVLIQRPAASKVQSFRAWKEAGRCVRKGERALWILAPTTKRKGGDEEAEGKEAEKPREDTDGKTEGEAEGSKKKAAPGFVPVPVFDVSQTDAIEEVEAGAQAATA